MIKSNNQTGTEAQILSAARTVFQRKGTAGARMADIAEEAGVNQALLHYYFRNKARLADAVFLGAARELFPPVLEVLQSDTPLPDKVSRVVELELDTLQRHPYLPGYVIAELNQRPERVEQLAKAMTGQEISAFGPRVLGRIGQQIDAAVAAGEMRPIPADQFIVNLISLCIFPFAARPMIAALTQVDDNGWDAMIERRKVALPIFFLEGLRP
jgi:TetR/AcrR family transcriptional regulator